MSKKAAIQLALATQMAIDGKPPLGLNGTLCGPLPTLPGEIANDAGGDVVRAHARELRTFANLLTTGDGGAGYDTNSLRTVFAKAAFILRSDDPPLKFNWSKIETAAAANSPLYLVIEMIADLTSVVDEKREDNKPAQK